MKKVINSFIYVLIFIIIAFSLFGCGKKETPPHTHFYVKTIVEPTCQQEGYTVYKCSCGDSYIADKVDKVEHSIGSNKCKWCSVNYFQSLADWVIENRRKQAEIDAEDYGVDIEKLDEINKYHYVYNFKTDMPQALIRYTPVANLFYVAIKYVYDIDDEFLGKETITVFRFNRFDYTYTWQTTINTGDSDNPIAMIGSLNCNTFENKNATITICHSKTQNLKSETKQADILISAVGKPKFIKQDWIKKDTIIIDVGINRDSNGEICGDIDFDNVKEKASYITPVPGGIGPMTIAMLMQNTIIAATINKQ